MNFHLKPVPLRAFPISDNCIFIILVAQTKNLNSFLTFFIHPQSSYQRIIFVLPSKTTQTLTSSYHLCCYYPDSSHHPLKKITVVSSSLIFLLLLLSFYSECSYHSRSFWSISHSSVQNPMVVYILLSKSQSPHNGMKSPVRSYLPLPLLWTRYSFYSTLIFLSLCCY